MFLRVKCLFCLLMPALSLAGQQITILNNGEGVAQIARGALNRIYIESDQVAQITSLNGELMIQKDLENGQFFVKPLEERREDPIDIFISTEKGHHFALSLKPLTIKAQNIGIQLKEKPHQLDEHKLVSIIKEMNELDLSTTLTEEPIEEEKLRINNHTLIKKQVVRHGGWQGEILAFTNKQKDVYKVDVKDFWQPGVSAVALEKDSLAQGEATKIFVVKSYG